MQIKTEEISLEELNNNVVEYVLKSPHNTNPAILRQMLNSRGGSAPAKSTIIFTISSDTDLGDEINGSDIYLANIITGEAISPEELAKITLSGTGFFAQSTNGSAAVNIHGKNYALGQILGFCISDNSLGITTISPTNKNITYISIINPEYKEAYFEALLQEIS